MLAIYSNEAQRSLTGFGEIPNDFDAAIDLQTYTPVRQGWYVGIPVNGNLGQNLAEFDPAQRGQIIQQQQLQTYLQAAAAVSMVTLAVIGVINAVRDWRR